MSLICYLTCVLVYTKIGHAMAVHKTTNLNVIPNEREVKDLSIPVALNAFHDEHYVFKRSSATVTLVGCPSGEDNLGSRCDKTDGSFGIASCRPSGLGAVARDVRMNCPDKNTCVPRWLRDPDRAACIPVTALFKWNTHPGSQAVFCKDFAYGGTFGAVLHTITKDEAGYPVVPPQETIQESAQNGGKLIQAVGPADLVDGDWFSKPFVLRGSFRECVTNKADGKIINVLSVVAPHTV